MDEDLGCTPGSYLYSTHAYTVLGAVIEKFEGKPMASVVRDELTTPFGLTTLRPESLAGSLPDRVQLYKTNNDEYDGDDMSNKTLGGGLVSTARDLVRFGDAILDGTLLTAGPAHDAVVAGIGSYAYGWNVPARVRLDVRRQVRRAAGRQVVPAGRAQRGHRHRRAVQPLEGRTRASSVSKKIGDAMLP